MKFVDSFSFPAPVKAAIEWQAHAHNPDSDISCTGLIDSPLVYWLKKKYYDVVREEYADALFRLNGTLMHLVLERFGEAAGAGHLELDVAAMVLGWKVSAKLDNVLAGDMLADYKYTSAWAVASGVKPEWERQLNVGLWIMRHDENKDNREIGASVKRLEICALLKDFGSRLMREKKFDGTPQFPCGLMRLPVIMWDDAFTENYIEERVALHKAAAMPDGGVPAMCSDDERWMKDFAVMKEGSKRAMKAGIKTREEAEEWMEKLGGTSIRESIPMRCSTYCVFAKPLNKMCPYWDTDNQCVRSQPVLFNDSPVSENPDHKRKDG